MGQKLGTAQIIYDDTSGHIVGLRFQDVEYLLPFYTRSSSGAITPLAGPVTSLASAQLTALTTTGAPSLTTVGIAALTTAQLTGLTTDQVGVLNTMWTNNDQIVAALKKIGSES